LCKWDDYEKNNFHAKRKKVIAVGGGFAGMQLLRRLDENIFDVLLIDKISTSISDFDYYFLVIAIGCKTNFFGKNEICSHSLTLKTTYDAIKIRNHIVKIFEKIISLKEDKREAYLNLVIVGAGATGVELAVAFAEIKKNVLPKDFHRIDFSKFQIYLVEGSKNTLNNMSDKARVASRNIYRKWKCNC